MPGARYAWRLIVAVFDAKLGTKLLPNRLPLDGFEVTDDCK
jgi:hypothetical protein